MPSLPAQALATSSGSIQTNIQYHYQSNAEDLQLILELEEYLIKEKLSLTMPAHILAASPTICKNLAEKLKVQHMETNEYKVVSAEEPQALALPCPTMQEDTSYEVVPQSLTINQSPTFCLPLQEIDMLVNCSLKVPAILDTSSQINIIQHNIIQSLGAYINYQWLIEMEGANSTTNWIVGCTKNLTLQVGNMLFKVHAHIVKHASFDILLG